MPHHEVAVPITYRAFLAADGLPKQLLCSTSPVATCAATP